MILTKEIKMQWNKNPSYRKWFIDKGYKYSGNCREFFLVRVEDLMPTSCIEVNFKCDYCGNEEEYRQYKVILKGKKIIEKDACSNCTITKRKETNMIKYGVEHVSQTMEVKEKYKTSLKPLIDERRHPFEYVLKSFQDKNYRLLTNNYQNNNQTLEFVCASHAEAGVQTTTFNMFHSKTQCKHCLKERMKNDKINNLEKLNKVDFFNKILKNEAPNFPSGFFKYTSDEEIKDILNIFFNYLVNIKEVSSIDNLPQELRTDHFKKYKLGTLINQRSIYDLLNLTSPNKYKKWEMCSVGNDYWNDKTIMEAGQWLINKLHDDKVITELDDILNISSEIFNDYKLEGLANKFFKGSLYDFMNFIYPNRWFEWEYRYTRKNFWSSSEKRINAIRQLAENKLKLKIEEIPQKLTYPFLITNFSKFGYVCDKYYQSNIVTWINEAYPNQFKNEDFYGKHISSDGYCLDSDEERIIHEHLITKFADVLYFDNNQSKEHRWVNNDEFYIADWMINGNIIVEYFGLYNPKCKPEDKILFPYKEKTQRKIQYYKSLNGYVFIDLYPKDLRNNLKGLKEKLDKYAEIGEVRRLTSL